MLRSQLHSSGEQLTCTLSCYSGILSHRPQADLLDSPIGLRGDLSCQSSAVHSWGEQKLQCRMSLRVEAARLDLGHLKSPQ